jgi:hypothetical protein
MKNTARKAILGGSGKNEQPPHPQDQVGRRRSHHRVLLGRIGLLLRGGGRTGFAHYVHYCHYCRYFYAVSLGKLKRHQLGLTERQESAVSAFAHVQVAFGRSYAAEGNFGTPRGIGIGIGIGKIAMCLRESSRCRRVLSAEPPPHWTPPWPRRRCRERHALG